MRRPNAPCRHRPGFTLVELLVVIVILVVLIGLLVPAVMRAVGTAKDAATSAEINALAQALADFKSQYGEYPPSRIVLCENGNYTTSGTGANPGLTGKLALLVPRSVVALRKFFPRMAITTSGSTLIIPGPAGSQFYDFNGNGVPDATPYILQGHQCLVFFLGGVPQPLVATPAALTGNQFAMMGFSRNPSNPFFPFTAATASPTNRTTPLFDFKSSRLYGDMTLGLSGVFFPGYIDNLGAGDAPGFYAYFSAYGGVGYDPDDVNFDATDTLSAVEPDDSGNAPIYGAFMVTNDPTNVGTTRADLIGSTSPNPYTSNPPIPVDATGALDTSTAISHRPRAYINAQSFQIISAGRDRLYGIGGQYQQGQSLALPFNNAVNQAITGKSYDNNIRVREQDNLTNFSQGGLY